MRSQFVPKTDLNTNHITFTKMEHRNYIILPV